MDAPLWQEGASAWPHEREALAFVKSRLPNHEPYRAWTNVEFIADDGSVNEVDLLVVTPQGFFLVEVKSFPGTLFGDGQRWRRKRPDGTEQVLDHPLLLANTKAKRLRSLLGRQGALKGEQAPYVTALVFLSSAELDCRLHAIGRTGVLGRDPDPATPTPPARTAFAPLPGIVAALKDPSSAGLRGHAVNKPLSGALAQAIAQAGLHPSNRGRRAGDWEVGALLDEGAGWQDFLATRPRTSATRRARIYLCGAATTAEESQRLRDEAEREFNLTQRLRHDGIAAALDLVQADRGPALLFDHVDGEQRLDLWAAEHLGGVDLADRIDLVRQVAEALAHAHGLRITHRALTARCVLVRPPGQPGPGQPGPGQPGAQGALPRLVVGHWQAGVRDLATRLTRLGPTATTTTTTTPGADLAERLSAADQVYLAPEVFSAEAPDGVALDVFSLGALAHLLLSQQPPAGDLAQRQEALQAHHGLALDAAVDGAPEALALAVSAATHPVPAQRCTIRELLALLDDALDALTAPTDTTTDADPDARRAVADPLSAHPGDMLEGGWEVVRRLGSGSTAVALLCRREGAAEAEVLKVAKDEDHAERLRDEYRALNQLRHPGIVEAFGLERVGGRTTLRLAPAGNPDPKNDQGMTLADRLTAHGRLGLDLLERFGDDLLDAVAYLESEGIAHRDLKPDNLGVRPRRGDRSLHLVLFDLSLTRAPDTNLTAGTVGYLDPFLAERPARRWDPAADRYAAAATLYEMATGTRPVWGDGRTDPLHLDDTAPRLDAGLLDPAVRDGLAGFFARALHRRPAQRFDTALQMREAWRAVFAAAARPLTTVDDRPSDAADLDRLADAADADTPLAELGLSGAAVGALERLGLNTVGRLLAFPAVEWNRAVGVGLQVRREVLELIGRLRERFDTDADPADASASIDRLAQQLVAKATTAQAARDQEPLRLLLGLDDQLTLDAAPLTSWPGPAEVKAHCGLDRAGYDALLERARNRWAKQPGITQARHDIAAVVERAGGVLSADEVGLALLAQRGSTATGPGRQARARAVVRAALEAEASRAGNRFTWRRLRGGAAAVVALRADPGGREPAEGGGIDNIDSSDGIDGEELADYAAHLGAEADVVARTDPLPSPTAALERLRRVPTPAGLAPLPDHRLARLAAAASATAAVSSRLELYPRGLAPERAVRLARPALLGAGTLGEEEVRARVRTRFPDAAPLPERPALDALLADTLGLQWFAEGPDLAGRHQPSGFRAPPPPDITPSTAVGGSGSRYRTGTVLAGADDRRAGAEATHDRLTRHAAAGGYLVLTVEPNRHGRAVDALGALGAAVVDLDDVIVGALRAHTAAKRIDWARAVVAADAAGSDGPHWARLLTVVRDALAPVKHQLLTGARHVLVTNPGLLARYDQLGLLDELREHVTRHPVPGQALHTLWVLVPSGDPAALPTLAGRAVPVTTGAEHLALGGAWLENTHRTRTGAPS